MLVMYVLTGWISGETVAEERGGKSLSSVLVLPASRSKIYWTKVLAALSVSGACLAAYLLVAVALLGLAWRSLGAPLGSIAVAINGDAAMSPTNVVVLPPIAYLALAFLLALANLFVIVGFGSLASVLVRTGAAGVGLSLLLVFLSIFGRQIADYFSSQVYVLVPGWAHWLWIYSFDLLGTETAQNGLGLGSLQVAEAFGSLMIWGGLFAIAGWAVFRRAELVRE